MKIFLAKLYGVDYPNIKIEVRYAAETRYKPDLIALDDQGEALFWGECGEVSSKKLGALIKKYPRTHLCFAKWNIHSGNIRSGNIRPSPFEQMIERVVGQLKRSRRAPVDFINFADSHQSRVADDGEVLLNWSEINYRRWD